MKYLAFATGLFAATMAVADTPVLTIYAPDYFTSEWGPGPGIEKAFEAECACDVQFVAGDLLPRLMLEGKDTPADIVIGLNTDVTKKARATGLFAPHGQDNARLTLPVVWADDVFLPFNYGHTAFIYDDTRMANPPKSFEELLAMPDDAKIVIQDPRTSISGLALALWVQSVYGDGATDAWARLAPKILTVTQGWSESYGMFTEGEADMVLSYTTSPAYHIAAENDLTKHAAIFPEGHYFMVELAAKVASTDQPELADKFMAFILSDTFQTMIPMSNWSFPSAQSEDKWPQVFRDLPKPEKVLFYSEDEADALRETAIGAWQQAMTK